MVEPEPGAAQRMLYGEGVGGLVEGEIGAAGGGAGRGGGGVGVLPWGDGSKQKLGLQAEACARARRLEEGGVWWLTGG